jgi:hypothetical protein
VSIEADARIDLGEDETLLWKLRLWRSRATVCWFVVAPAVMVVKKSNKGHAARAAMAALEPLLELLLELGVTSPEAESLLRSIFVHKAHSWLKARISSGKSPSDALVSLATGVHRNFVREILASAPGIAPARDRRGLSAGRLLDIWRSDRKYLDNNGNPQDLNEGDREPSFRSLVAACLPGAAPGVVLAELKRAGHVQSLRDHRVRIRSTAGRSTSVSLGDATVLGTRAKNMLDTLHHNLRHPTSPLFYGEMPPIDVDMDDLARVRELINRRASTFLAAIASELAPEAKKHGRRKRTRRVRVGLGLFETQQPT